ncbi:unnamed protein product [Spirodela intermedia]|uniref:Uncharacterized protein n=1 Tax=Spirodela intermedia TaxID=51605 RepID=A0A7I8IE17_SPIIN|nr:unnamed protein product [Spirodela intermedia]CAA6656057.1 unnamed protein product [Spirodela intermedia]
MCVDVRTSALACLGCCV